MPQLTRQDWLRHGLSILAEQGVDALRIGNLCTQLGVTKGSFYHHFSDHQAFLEALLEHWETEQTLRFIEESQEGETVQAQLRILTDRVLTSFGGHEIHIRSWAHSDPLAHAFQTRVDEQRVSYLYQLYRQLIDDDTQALAMAHLAYTTLIGSINMIPPLTAVQYEQITKLFEPLLRSLSQKDEH
ncbi:MAG: TetR/AcrR family transcriptional regulator [Chloroflexi bacterium]|nr:TetR/AcrR family transcriptional regulator [Chloroflexota bacterium]